MKHKKYGFTLVELIVVATIIGILATIGFVSYTDYITGVRDTSRIGALRLISEGLETYKRQGKLMVPDEYIEIKNGSEVLGYQGYAGESVLEKIKMKEGGKDPKDGLYYSYYLDNNRQDFQLLAFLEEEQTVSSFISTTYAATVDYSDRYSKVIGTPLGILTQSGTNSPAQEITSISNSGYLDLSSSSESLTAHFSDTETFHGSQYGIIGALLDQEEANNTESKIELSTSAAGFFNCVKLANGTVKCWGGNSLGQVGDGTQTDRSSPTLVSSLSDVQELSTGGNSSCALIENGTVKCWGYNYYGQLGDGTTTTGVSGLSTTPVTVVGLNNTQQITVGYEHACALLSNDTVKCWGKGNVGQMGNGDTTTTNNSPVNVSISNVKQISARGNHTCAVLNDDTVQCWGENGSGELGDGSTTQRNSPVSVPSLSTVKKVTAGAASTCALMNDTTVKCWGNNTDGQLGNGNTTQQTSPVSVSSLSNVKQVILGQVNTSTNDNRHACALLYDKTMKCWGYNQNYQLGDGTNTSPRTTSVSVSGVSNIKQITAGAKYSCALDTSDNIKCWGAMPTGTNYTTPTLINGL